MKKLLLALVSLSSFANELNVTTLETKQVNYENGRLGASYFKILCINGYKWLQYETSSGSISQMFESNINGVAKPIKCENK